MKTKHRIDDLAFKYYRSSIPDAAVPIMSGWFSQRVISIRRDHLEHCFDLITWQNPSVFVAAALAGLNHDTHIGDMLLSKVYNDLNNTLAPVYYDSKACNDTQHFYLVFSKPEEFALFQLAYA